MLRIPKPAQYLLRIDDLSPGLKWETWTTIRDLMRGFEIRPVLAIVPDNQDRWLKARSPYEGFWNEMRAMQEEGATIAQHGYQHRCVHESRGLLPLHRRSEFAGLSLSDQRRKIRAGAKLLNDQGLAPRLFVAPNHSFDETTLQALRLEGFAHLSDGFAMAPFLRLGITWIPQQLWSPALKKKGLWTICLHPNTMRLRHMLSFKNFVQRYSTQFTSFDRVSAEFMPEELTFGERIQERLALWRVLIRRQRKRRRN